MCQPTRRQALLAGGAACASLLAGCSGADATYPDDPSGPRHLTLKNCTASEAGVDVALTVRPLASDTVVHDATHTVPDGYCSDMGDSYSIYEVWDGAGEYRVRAAAPATGATVDLPVELTDAGGEDTRAPVKLVVSGDEFDVFLNERTRRADADSSGPRT
jgi:hypothetical protein